MGNQDQHTVEAVAKAIQQSRGLKSFAAQMLGCSRQTVSNYCVKYPHLLDVLKEAKSMTIDMAEHKLYERMMAGDAWAVCFFLKTQAKARGYIERQEVTGRNGGPIATQTEVTHTIDLAKLNVKQLEALHDLVSLTGPDSEPIDITGHGVDSDVAGNRPATGELLPASLH